MGDVTAWTAPNIEAAMRKYAADYGVPFRDLCAALRLVLTGRTVSPPLFACMEALGREETLARLWTGYEDWCGRKGVDVPARPF